jgi:hypothetical protein
MLWFRIGPRCGPDHGWKILGRIAWIYYRTHISWGRFLFFYFFVFINFINFLFCLLLYFFFSFDVMLCYLILSYLNYCYSLITTTTTTTTNTTTIIWFVKAQVGGPIALLKDGDKIKIDAKVIWNNEHYYHIILRNITFFL